MPGINDDTFQLRFDFVPGTIDQQQGLVYMWEIVDPAGVIRYRYVGKASGGAGRPLRHYVRNVRNRLAGKPYRRNKPGSFRIVHVRLAQATRLGWSVRLYLLCNVQADDNINALERDYHQRYALDTIGDLSGC